VKILWPSKFGLYFGALWWLLLGQVRIPTLVLFGGFCWVKIDSYLGVLVGLFLGGPGGVKKTSHRRGNPGEPTNSRTSASVS